MYVYINSARACGDMKLRDFSTKKHLTSVPEEDFFFALTNGSMLYGRTTPEGARVECKVLHVELQTYFLYCSTRVEWSPQAHRYTGVYKLGKATGTLELKVRHKMTLADRESSYYELVVESKNVDDCNELVRLVRKGDIDPVENWELPPRRWFRILFGNFVRDLLTRSRKNSNEVATKAVIKSLRNGE